MPQYVLASQPINPSSWNTHPHKSFTCVHKNTTLYINLHNMCEGMPVHNMLSWNTVVIHAFVKVLQACDDSF